MAFSLVVALIFLPFSSSTIKWALCCYIIGFELSRIRSFFRNFIDLLITNYRVREKKSLEILFFEYLNHFVLHQEPTQGVKRKFSVIGLASLNLADCASKTDDCVTEVKIPLAISSTAVEHRPLLCVSNWDLKSIFSFLFSTLTMKSLWLRPIFIYVPDISQLVGT